MFALTAAEGKLFTPLAFTKSFAMVAALILSMIVLPALAHVLITPDENLKVSTFKQLRRMLIFRWRDSVLMGLGIVMLKWTLIGGLFVIILGLFRIVQDVLPSHLRKYVRWTENTIAIVTVTILLTADWMPLGVEQGGVVNLVFVIVTIVGLLGVFMIFDYYYRPILRWSLRNKAKALVLPVFVVLFGFTTWLGFDSVFSFLPSSVKASRPLSSVSESLPGFGSEFMPPFDEGSFLYMPTTMPHASLGQALEALQNMDAAIAAIPEVERAVGKLGRAETPLDPAPVSMFETVINYKSEYSVDEDGNRVRQWRDHIRSPQDIWDEITKAAQAPGLTSAPMLMPINTRIIMLQSGMRAPMGIKVKGPTLEAIEAFGLVLEEHLKKVPSIRSETVFADRVVGKPYIEIDIDREAIGRYGLSIRKVQNVIQVALGGRILTRTVEGRERYPVRVRYMREERDSIEALARIFVPSPGGEQIPLEQIATIRYSKGPQVIKSEDTFLTSYVLFDKVGDAAEVGVVEEADMFLKKLIADGVIDVPAGVQYEFAGAYENQTRSEKKLRILVPLAMVIVFLILYMQFRRISTALIIFSGVSLCVAGGFSLIWLYGRPWFLDFEVFGVHMRDLFQVGTINLSVAVWIGFIALLGIATDAGVVMATYLAQRFRAKPPMTVEEVHERAVEAGSRRVRPCLMTTATTALALLPVVSSQGRGADVMVPMALPSIGGMGTILLTLFTVPLLYAWVEEARLRRRIASAIVKNQ